MSLIYRVYEHEFLRGKPLLIIGDGVTPSHIYYDRENNDNITLENTTYGALCTQLDEYFSGRRKRFDMPVNLASGTVLQQQHWQHLCAIPYGKTLTYTELAAKSTSPKAVRATASACAVNPLPIVIPCHRVVGKDGALRGFAWGLELKQRLLDFEKSIM